jgi:hypothetical protein
MILKQLGLQSRAITWKLALVLASTFALDLLPLFSTSLLTTRYLPGGAFSGIGNRALPA